MKLTCDGAPCSGTLTLTETVTVRTEVGQRRVTKKKTVNLASSVYSLKEGTSRLVYIPLTPAQHGLLTHLATKTLLRETLIATVKGGSRTTKMVLVS